MGPDQHVRSALGVEAPLHRRGAVGEVVTEAGAGVSSLVLHAHRPFHPRRLQTLLETPFDGVLRGRGIAWLASRPELALRCDHAGPTLSLEPDRIWSTTGERGQALELLGIDLDAGAIHEALEAALLSDDELATPASSWRALHETFPAWGAEAIADLPCATR